jgi:hypothetical protein
MSANPNSAEQGSKGLAGPRQDAGSKEELGQIEGVDSTAHTDPTCAEDISQLEGFHKKESMSLTKSPTTTITLSVEPCLRGGNEDVTPPPTAPRSSPMEYSPSVENTWRLSDEEVAKILETDFDKHIPGSYPESTV